MEPTKSVTNLATGVFWLACVFLPGCSHQDFSNVSLTAPLTDVYQAGKPYVPEDTQEQNDRSRHMALIMEEWRKSDSSGARTYHVGADDVLALDILSLDEPGKVSKLQLAVQGDGCVNLPWVGLVRVGGLTLREVEAQVKTALAGRFIKDPQVAAAVAQYRSAPVVITGAVQRPGIYYLRSDASTLLELLIEAAGVSAGAGSQLILIRNRGTNTAAIAAAVAESARLAPPAAATNSEPAAPAPAVAEPVPLAGPEVATNAEPAASAPSVVEPIPVPASLSLTNSDNVVVVDLKQLIEGGDLRQNLWVRGGDILNIPLRARDVFYVLGYVQRPGGYEMNKDKPPGALQAVAMAGGLTGSARSQNSCLLRPTTNGLQVIAVDLTKIMRGARPPFAMAPGDTLVIGSSFMARVAEFVRPSVGIAAGATTTLGVP